MSQGAFDDGSLAPDQIFPFNHTIPATSPYKRFQPYLTIQRGCGPFAAIDAKGHHSAGLSGIGDYFEDCEIYDHPKNLQMYTRWWSVPNTPGRFALMYAIYHPKVIQDLDSEKEDARNHRHLWHQYSIFFDRVVNDAKPYACAFQRPDKTVVGLPWNQCFISSLTNERPVILIDLAELKVGTSRDVNFDDDDFYGTFNLAAWEFLHIDEIRNFNSVNWSPATCLMQDVHFPDAMKAFYAATERFTHK